MTEPGRKGFSKFDRVLVVDPNVATAKMLANLLRSMWPSSQVYGAQSGAKAMLLAGEIAPQLIFLEDKGPELDGMAFTSELRRSDLACREAPIVMIFTDVTAAQLLAARDSGVHELLRRPFTMGDLEKRLQAVSGRPRDWIDSEEYTGPDRRRFNTAAGYKGPKKRGSDASTKMLRIHHALMVIQSATAQLEADPVKAARALNAQARVLIELCSGQEPLKRLAMAATYLQAYLQNTAQKGAPLTKDQVETYAANVLLVAPEEVRPEAA